MKRSRVCGVGATPGLTKSTQEVTLDKNIKLIDCPGIVFSKTVDEKEAAQVMLRNCVKVELLEDPIPPGKYQNLTLYTSFLSLNSDDTFARLDFHSLVKT